MGLRCASFNVLADAYLGYGDYRHVAPSLLQPEARIPYILRVTASMKADVICLQEVEIPLLAALDNTRKWQLFWSPKQNSKPDGCLTLVRPGINTAKFDTHPFPNSDHIMQSIMIDGVTFSNTHIQWAPANDPHHAGIAQTRDMLKQLGAEQPAVIFADCNDRPGGPVRALISAAGFTNTCGNEPTALIGEEHAALDLIAARGVRAKRIATAFHTKGIPNQHCPSDHIPVMASIETA